MLDKKIQEEVQRLIKGLPIDELENLIHYLRSIIEKSNERSLPEHLAYPIYDNEDISPSEETAVAEALEDIKAGRVYDLEEIKKEFGL